MREFKVVLSDRGQVVVPAEIRKKFKTREFRISYEDGKIIMFPTNQAQKMKTFVSRITDMNNKYEKYSKEEIDVLSEIKNEGA